MPTQVDQQNHEDPTHSGTEERGSDDEAIEAFNRRLKSQASDQDDHPNDESEEPEASPEADPEEDAAEPDTDEATDLVEVEFEGETVMVPKKVEQALMRQADYTRKTKDVAAARKDYASRIEAIERREQGVEKLAKAIGKVEAIDAQLASFKDTDWEKLEAENPQQASILGLRAMRLQHQRVAAVSEAEAIDRQIAGERQTDLHARQGEMLKTLAKEFPGGWDEKAGERVTEYARKAGFSVPEIQRIADARLILALEKARKFDAIEAGKAKALKAGREAQPVVRPGSPRPAGSAMKDVETRFRKSRSDDDAVALFEARAARR